jgi:hypothetical protein
MIGRGTQISGTSIGVDEKIVRNIPPDRGRILYPDLWYLGFCDLLASLSNACETQKASTSSHPLEVAAMFDKTATCRLLSEHGVAVPEYLGSPCSYDDLMAMMSAADCRRVFLKLRYSSSASGTVALEVAPKAAHAWSSVELCRRDGEIALYNSLRVRRYSSLEEIRTIINELCRSSVHVERWIPKASLDRHSFDIRIVTIGMVPQHRVLRLSRSPLTNLHLGNRRGSPDSLPDQLWQEVEMIATRSALCFPRTSHCGIDVLVPTQAGGKNRALALEVNAFGDLLPGLSYRGLNTYEAQLAHLCNLEPEKLAC